MTSAHDPRPLPEGQRELWWRSGRGHGRRIGGKSEVLEDAANRGRVGDEGEELAASVAVRETMTKVGGGRARIASILALEVVFVVGSSIALAGILTAATRSFGGELVRAFALS